MYGWWKFRASKHLFVYSAVMLIICLFSKILMIVGKVCNDKMDNVYTFETTTKLSAYIRVCRREVSEFIHALLRLLHQTGNALCCMFLVAKFLPLPCQGQCLVCLGKQEHCRKHGQTFNLCFNYSQEVNFAWNHNLCWKLSENVFQFPHNSNVFHTMSHYSL